MNTLDDLFKVSTKLVVRNGVNCDMIENHIHDQLSEGINPVIVTFHNRLKDDVYVLSVNGRLNCEITQTDELMLATPHLIIAFDWLLERW
jgi:hypothetical protein